jgi:multicomponent Na+:H+ antiporter subunit D
VAEPLTAVPPALVALAGAAVVARLPRRAGAAFGAILGVGVAAWVAALPAGVHLRASLFGFDALPFVVTPAGRTVALALAAVVAAGTAYGYGTGATRRHLSLALAYLGAGLGAVLAGDWLTLVVWWELLAVGATALVWTTGDDAARRAGLRYAVYHEVGGLALLGAVLARYVETGTVAFGQGFAGGLLALVAAFGIGLNVAFVGLHAWLVDTYPRPHVAASVVLAACTTKVGVFALYRAFPDGSVAIAYVGGVMLLVGVTYAILQTEMRRLLSYHVVSQVGFMVAGVGVGSSLGVAGAFAHLLNNVLYKSLLFMVAGVLVVRTGEESLKRLGGLARPMPVTFAAFVVAAVSISGVPGTNGFVSKAMVVDAAEDAGLRPLWWMLVVGSVGTAVSFLKFGYYAFFDGSGDDEERAGVDDASPAAAVALAAFAVPCLVFGVRPALQFLVLPGSTAAAKPFATSQFVKAAAILGAGGVAFLALRGPLSRVRGAPDVDSLYHPLGARALRLTVDRAGRAAAAVDSGVRETAAAAVRLEADPSRLSGAVPTWVTAGGLGRSVLLVVLAAAALLFVSVL